jgi:hypothetical protein
MRDDEDGVGEAPSRSPTFQVIILVSSACRCRCRLHGCTCRPPFVCRRPVEVMLTSRVDKGFGGWPERRQCNRSPGTVSCCKLGKGLSVGCRCRNAPGGNRPNTRETAPRNHQGLETHSRKANPVTSNQRCDVQPRLSPQFASHIPYQR